MPTLPDTPPTAPPWQPVTDLAVPAYWIPSYGRIRVFTLNKALPSQAVEIGPGTPPTPPKRDEELIVAGYASPQIIDQQRHLITKEAMARDLPRFLANPKFRNCHILHSNIQVGEVLPVWRNPQTGETFRTKVDDIGLFTVVRIRTDKDRPPVMDEVIRDIKSGKLSSFSISADAPFEARRYVCQDGACFHIIDRIYFYEITLCQKPVNQDAHYQIIYDTTLRKARHSPDHALALAYRPSSYCRDGICMLDQAPPPAVPRTALDDKYERLSRGLPPLPRLRRARLRLKTLAPHQRSSAE